MTRILVLSDTHGLSLRRVEDIIKREKCDITVHCGDYGYSPDVMDNMFTYYVDGNNDFNSVQERQIRTFKAENFNFLVMHGHQVPRIKYRDWLNGIHKFVSEKDADVVLFGHSHHFEIREYFDHKILVNPGSIALPDNMQATYLVITIDKGEIRFTKKVFEL